MTVVDFLVIALYALGMLAVGHYYSRQSQTADQYLLGGRNMSPFMIGLSLFATLTSTLTYLALPGEMIKYGPMIFAEFVAFPFVFVVVGWVLIPWIMRQRVTSGYELLETRLGVTGRLLGAAMFVALRVVWMASILYATSDKVLIPLLELDQRWMPALSLAMGAITLLYTVEGGLKAVVVTDAVQSVLMFAGAITIVVVVSVGLGGVGAWWPASWPAHWQEPMFWPDPAIRVTFVGAFLNMFVWLVCTAGSDQMAIQRYLATRDAASARRSLGIHLGSGVLSAALLALAGLAVLGYFSARPQELPSGESILKDADKLLPHFIVIGLPSGVTGLVIAAILAAAMSSLSSGMNSASAVIASDFVSRLRRQVWTQEDGVRLARYASVFVGVVAVLLSLVVGGLAENLLVLCMKVVNLLSAPLFVLFFLALFVPWSSPFGALAATVASVAVALEVAFLNVVVDLTFLWIAPLSLLAGIAIGMLASLAPIGRRTS